ncbi:Rv3654c family TadE-like protein [Agromyces sp. NPDC060279]|uniref:Rv3654c family TadE-like protein n=1 Tax=Agromyces sp. NPDC060279 TaxID=3347092 RepID=UPI0036670C46
MSGSVLAVGVVGACAASALVVLPLLGVHVEHQRAAHAADAAALAAADAVSGAVPGVPCELAAELARRNGASLTACEADGAIATVAVEIGLPLGSVGARAKAGPPPAGTSTSRADASVEDGLDEAVVDRGRTGVARPVEFEAGAARVDIALAGIRVQLDTGARVAAVEEGGRDGLAFEWPVDQLGGVRAGG